MSKLPQIGPFPAAEGDGMEPFRQIGRYLEISEYRVSDLFRGLPVPEWSTPHQLDAQRAAAKALNQAMVKAGNFLEAYRDLPSNELDMLIQEGCITLAQIEHTVRILTQDFKTMDSWSKEQDRRGGRNPAAYAISEGIRRVFRRCRWAITFGQFEGVPTTDFGRTVLFSLNSFGVIADWRNPTQAAYHKQQGIQSRLIGCGLKSVQAPMRTLKK